MRIETFLAWVTQQLWLIGSSFFYCYQKCAASSCLDILGILFTSWLSVFAICCRFQTNLNTVTRKVTDSLVKRISRNRCRPSYGSNSKLLRASHQLLQSPESVRHSTAGPLAPSQPCGPIHLPWNTRRECSCHRKLKQVTDSHMSE